METKWLLVINRKRVARCPRPDSISIIPKFPISESFYRSITWSNLMAANWLFLCCCSASVSPSYKESNFEIIFVILFSFVFFFQPFLANKSSVFCPIPWNTCLIFWNEVFPGSRMENKPSKDLLCHVILFCSLHSEDICSGVAFSALGRFHKTMGMCDNAAFNFRPSVLSVKWGQFVPSPIQRGCSYDFENQSQREGS